jgi:Helix-turn-helix domain
LTESEAAKKLGVNQPKVSALASYKLDGFSVERLMTFLTALDQDVEIVIKNKPRNRTAGRISVIVASSTETSDKHPHSCRTDGTSPPE